VTIVPHGGSAAALAPLPVEALRLPAKVVAVLRELGIDTVGLLAALPRAALAERFDPALLLRLDQALGGAAEVFAVCHDEPSEEASLNWESGIASIEPLVAACERLLPRLTRPVGDRAHGVARLLVELTGESQRLRRLVVGLLRPTLDLRHLLDLVRLRLESCRLVEPVTELRVAVLEEAPPAVEQQTLFDDAAPRVETQAWRTLVERLAGRLGADAVGRVRRMADHQPERAWKAEPWLDRASSGSKSTAAPSSRRKRTTSQPAAAPASATAPAGPPRPTLLLAEPRAVQVVASQPEGRPCRWRDGASDRRVVQCWGPERIETGWWRAPGIRRDYYRVETETGTHAWLFRDLRTRQWFLHGWFD